MLSKCKGKKFSEERGGLCLLDQGLQAANTALIDLYWKIGKTISRKIEASEWGDGMR